LHYVVGAPTPYTEMNSLALASATGTYGLLGATTPTFSNGIGGTLGAGTFSGSLSVAFATGSVTASSMSVNFPSPLSGPAQSFPISGSATFFSGSPYFGGTLTASNASYCSGTWGVQGFFAGQNAARAGLVYDLQTSFAGFNIQGAAAFTKTGP
jgi:hypothetical protein